MAQDLASQIPLSSTDPPFNRDVDLTLGKSLGQRPSGSPSQGGGGGVASSGPPTQGDGGGAAFSGSTPSTDNTSGQDATVPVNHRPNDPQSQSNSGSEAPQQQQAMLLDVVSASLPTIFQKRDQKSRENLVTETKDEIAQFVVQDLDVKRLTDIQGLLWMAGRPLAGRPLHRHKMLERRILRTEQADLHMLVLEQSVFLKPLPLYLLSHAFFQDYISKDQDLAKSANGFLLSYTWLIRSELDFQLAQMESLLPNTEPQITWLEWKSFVHSFLKYVDPNTLEQVNDRYHFGELRLGRINTIYRIAPRFFFLHFVRGYLYGYNRYGPFFQRRFAFTLVLFVWLSLILSAMQVGVAVDPLMSHSAFQQATFGFVVFSIVLVAFIIAMLMLLFGVIFLINMVLASFQARRERHARRLRAQKSNETLSTE